MSLYKLTLSTILTRKTFIVFAVLFLVLPALLPLITPWEQKPQLIEPARAQAAWGLLWLVALGWLFYQAAAFGDRWASHGVLEYFKTLGMSRLKQISQIWLSVLTLFAGFVAMVIVICLLFAMPGDSGEAKMWILTNLQYAWLFLLVVAPLALLAIALGTRLDATAAYVITAGVAVYGLFGIGYLDFFLSQTGSPFFDMLFIISPHYHLSDLTSRLVYKLGEMNATSFINISIYLLGLGLLTTAIACGLYREKK
jgi:hypothetical protein